MALTQKIKEKAQNGYTVIEVMIVLSVSALLFAAAISGYLRQNSKAQFTNAVREMETAVQDILNDVSTGFYPSSNSFDCIRQPDPSPGGSGDIPVINPFGSSEQGTNQDCIFLGKAVDLRNGAFTAYTLVGLRNSTNDKDTRTEDLDDARNRIVNVDGTFSRHELHASIDARVITGDGAESPGFAIVSGFGHGEKRGGAGATTTQVSLTPLVGGYNFSPTAKAVNDADRDKNVIICIRETGGDRLASITIGSGAQTNIETMIDGWATECE